MKSYKVVIDCQVLTASKIMTVLNSYDIMESKFAAIKEILNRTFYYFHVSTEVLKTSYSVELDLKLVDMKYYLNMIFQLASHKTTNNVHNIFSNSFSIGSTDFSLILMMLGTLKSLNNEVSELFNSKLFSKNLINIVNSIESV